MKNNKGFENAISMFFVVLFLVWLVLYLVTGASGEEMAAVIKGAFI